MEIKEEIVMMDLLMAALLTGCAGLTWFCWTGAADKSIAPNREEKL